MTATLAECLEFAVHAARRAGDIVMPYYQGEVAVDLKTDGSPVTAADRAAERQLRARIRAHFPADAVLGEEYGEEPGTSGRRWILDPIDGTKAFMRGVPLFGVLIGLEEAGQGVVGVAYLPALGEMVYAARGQGCWWVPAGGTAPRRAHVSSGGPLADSLVVVNSYEYFDRSNRTAALGRLQQAARQQRGWGDCYGHVLVATGRAEAAVDPIMNLWDNAPFQALLTEAGGTFTDWQGHPTIHGKDGISTNGRVLDEVLAALRG